ncbi:PREDICTED: uncharacterized protein LOC109465380 [Branchiostoma belcheri]|uniref:Uncharacterized protein LOC109465380 n=1 Tax=Branchiostoma belcheri TaxID=7741 RepID=A0A6P4Y715_BRABE|nr:PREDICTED: uncharacterized protein LOC109465380 [Branchiostoma belcheri]
MELKGRVLVYSIVGCPHCIRAKNYLEQLGLPYTDVSLDKYPQIREEVRTRTGKNTVPQIFFNAVHVGGNEELQKLSEEELQELIAEVREKDPPPDAPVPPDPLTAEEEEAAVGFHCEPDEYAMLVQELKQSGLIKDRKYNLRTYRNCFVGREFVDWLVKEKGLERAEAVEMGQKLVTRGFGHHVTDDHKFKDEVLFYRLLEDDSESALNAGVTAECQPRPAGELSEVIRKLILKIYSKHLSKDGKKVDYKGIGESPDFAEYVTLTAQLQRVNVTDLSREEKLAFFINIYNALVIHAYVKVGPPTNLWQRYKFFNVVSYIVGGHIYSLQDMENGVLRGNRKGIGQLFRPFGKDDPRLPVALENPEPLIHFALVCGAKSCPPIKTYSAQEVDKQLKIAAEGFLEGDDGIRVDMSRKEVSLSKIFKWYKVDFGSHNDEVLQWVYDHMSAGQKKSQVSELLVGKKYKLSHMSYDWGVNSK